MPKERPQGSLPLYTEYIDAHKNSEGGTASLAIITVRYNLLQQEQKSVQHRITSNCTKALSTSLALPLVHA